MIKNKNPSTDSFIYSIICVNQGRMSRAWWIERTWCYFFIFSPFEGDKSWQSYTLCRMFKGIFGTFYLDFEEKHTIVIFLLLAIPAGALTLAEWRSIYCGKQRRRLSYIKWWPVLNLLCSLRWKQTLLQYILNIDCTVLCVLALHSFP